MIIFTIETFLLSTVNVAKRATLGSFEEKDPSVIHTRRMYFKDKFI